MNFDVEKFRNTVLNAKNGVLEYEMKTVDPPVKFKLKPRTVARVERVLAVLEEDRERRARFLEVLEKGEIPDELPEPEYIIKWRVFKEIAEGDFSQIEENLKELLDLDVVERAIFDFFVPLT